MRREGTVRPICGRVPNAAAIGMASTTAVFIAGGLGVAAHTRVCQRVQTNAGCGGKVSGGVDVCVSVCCPSS